MSSSSDRPFLLERRLVERPWGGEIWHTAVEPLPLLIKFIYTREALSYQVHPGDEYAARHHESRGKTEMWYITSATAQARLALGLKEAVTTERLRAAAESGEIERLVNQVSPRPGEAYFTPAGTIHAIGAGLELWEIQENSDITYRLFDYGRGRELHLEHALNVTNTAAFDPTAARLPVCCPWFCVDKLALEQPMVYEPDSRRSHLIICVNADGSIAGQPLRTGDVWMMPAGAAPFELRPNSPCELLVAREP